MQPSQPNAQPPQQSPFDFMLNQQSQSGRRFSFQSRPAKILLLLGVVLVLIFIFSLAFGKKGPSNNAQIVDLIARDQEILRVTTANLTNFNDSNATAMAATVTTTITSQQTEFADYLAKHGIKPGTAELAKYDNKNTDVALRNALQNNNFETAYYSYIKTALQNYQSALVATSKNSSKNFNTILNADYISNRTLLASPEIANLPSS